MIVPNRLRRLEGQHAVSLLVFGAYALAVLPDHSALPGGPPWAWAGAMLLIGGFQAAVLLLEWVPGRVAAGLLNILIWGALLIGATQSNLVTARVAWFSVSFAYALWVFIGETMEGAGR